MRCRYSGCPPVKSTRKLRNAASILIPASAATTTAMGVTSALKLIPGIGTLIAAVTMPAFSAGATYLIGKVFIQHFASGGTLLDFNPPDYREFIKAQKEKLGMRPGAAASPSPSGAPAARNASSTSSGASSS